jgi:hypothetical protein
MPQQTVVVYRSRFEQQNDEFWFNHTDWIVWGVLIFIGVYALMRAWGYLLDIRDLRRRRKLENRLRARSGRWQM